jgi:hypothetical protein
VDYNFYFVNFNEKKKNYGYSDGCLTVCQKQSEPVRLLLLKKKKKEKLSWAQMAHTCNPSYLGGLDQKDHCSKPDWAKSSQDPISTSS